MLIYPVTVVQDIRTILDNESISQIIKVYLIKNNLPSVGSHFSVCELLCEQLMQTSVHCNSIVYQNIHVFVEKCLPVLVSASWESNPKVTHRGHQDLSSQ